MKIGDYIAALGVFLILRGIWVFVELRINIKGYILYKDQYNSFYEFCCDYYSNRISWKLRRILGLKRFYNSKIFIVLRSLVGLLFIALGFTAVVGVGLLKSSDYGNLLEIEL